MDPLKEEERKDLDWYLEEYWKWPYEGFEARAERIKDTLHVIGARLFDAVFRSARATATYQGWHLSPLAPGQRRQISIRTELAAASRLPWELLHDEQGFLALRNRHPVSIVRRLPQAQLSGLPGAFEPPLRGMVFEEEENWHEAERCYRESLKLKEDKSDVVGAAGTYNQLGIFTEAAGRAREAEDWYRRALQVFEDRSCTRMLPKR